MQVVVYNSTHLTSYGFDAILLTLLFYTLIFSPGRYTHYRHAMTAIYHRVIRAHLCLVYFVNGLSKISGHSWWDGSGMWDAIHQPQFQSVLSPLLHKLFMIGHLPAAVSLSIIALEIAYPFTIWIRGINRITLILTLLLHVFIALVFGLWLFAFVMIVFNLAAFGDVLSGRKNED
jgi:hypothetical protein